MEHADVQRWLDAYVDAWRSYDASGIGDLFAEDATYRWHPWDEGDRAVAIGVSRYLRADGSLDREYHNVFLCRFDADGRCVEFTEYFMRRTD